MSFYSVQNSHRRDVYSNNDQRRTEQSRSVYNSNSDKTRRIASSQFFPSSHSKESSSGRWTHDRFVEDQSNEVPDLSYSSCLINDKIANAKDLKDFYSLIDANISLFDKRNISSLLSQMTKRFNGKNIDSVRMQKVVDRVIDIINTFDPQAFATTAYTLGKLGVCDAKIFRKIAEEIKSKQSLSDFNQQDLTNILWAFATNKSDDGLLFKKIAREIESRGLQGFTPQNIGLIAWAFAKCEVDDKPLFTMIAKEVTSRRSLREFNSQNFNNIVYAFAVFQIDAELLFSMIAKEMASRKFSPECNLHDIDKTNKILERIKNLPKGAGYSVEDGERTSAEPDMREEHLLRRKLENLSNLALQKQAIFDTLQTINFKDSVETAPVIEGVSCDMLFRKYKIIIEFYDSSKYLSKSKSLNLQSESKVKLFRKMDYIPVVIPHWRWERVENKNLVKKQEYLMTAITKEVQSYLKKG